MTDAQTYQQQKHFIIKKMKEIVGRFDRDANVILFGSRARGDWHEESDWDFLILTTLKENNFMKDLIRTAILNEIELVSFDTVSTLFHNKQVWVDDYSVTNIYKSIEEEGVLL